MMSLSRYAAMDDWLDHKCAGLQRNNRKLMDRQLKLDLQGLTSGKLKKRRAERGVSSEGSGTEDEVR